MHARTHTQSCTHTHARTHTRTRAHTHTHTHTHTLVLPATQLPTPPHSTHSIARIELETHDIAPRLRGVDVVPPEAESSPGPHRPDAEDLFHLIGPPVVAVTTEVTVLHVHWALVELHSVPRLVAVRRRGAYS